MIGMDDTVLVTIIGTSILNSCMGIMSSSEVLMEDLINSTPEDLLSFFPALAAFLQKAVKLLLLEFKSPAAAFLEEVDFPELELELELPPVSS